MGLRSSLCLAAIFALALMSDLPSFCLAADYVVEIKVYVDETGFKQWKERVTGSSRPDGEAEAQIREFLVPIFLGVNENFKPLNIETRIVSVTFLKNGPQFDPKSTDDLNKMLNDFTTFTNADGAHSADHRLLLTGHDLFRMQYGKKNTYATGAAAVYGMCSYRSNSIVEFRRDAGLTHTISHELGHSFGARHDSGSPGCDNRRYLMSSSEQFDHDAHLVSTCTRDAINGFLSNQIQATELWIAKSDCLKQTTAAPIQGKSLGETYDTDKLCHIAFGEGYFFDRARFDPSGSFAYTNPSYMCTNLHCRNSDGLGGSKRPVNGARCAPDKACWQAECTKAVPSTGSSCVFTDLPDHILLSGRTNYCKTLTQADCTKDNRLVCCHRCKELAAQG